MVKQAGYEEIAARIDQEAIADQLTRLEPNYSLNKRLTLGGEVSRESHQVRRRPNGSPCLSSTSLLPVLTENTGDDFFCHGFLGCKK